MNRRHRLSAEEKEEIIRIIQVIFAGFDEIEAG